MTRFANRTDAGRQLIPEVAKRLQGVPVVLAITPGGVTIGYELAIGLNAPLDVFLVHKVLAPGHEEMAIGCVTSRGARLLNDDAIANLTAVEVEDVLDLSRIESNRFDLHVTQAPLSALLDALRPVAQTLCAQRGNRFEITHDASLEDLSLRTDQTVLRQILLNLLSNAAKFTTQGSVTLRVSKPDATHIRFEVIDTGAGIPDDSLERIFGEFEQVRGAHQESLKGTGLGLSLVRRLSALLGGEVSVQSAVGQGSTFAITLPDRPTDDVRLGQRRVAGIHAAGGGRHGGQHRLPVGNCAADIGQHLFNAGLQAVQVGSIDPAVHFHMDHRLVRAVAGGRAYGTELLAIALDLEHRMDQQVRAQIPDLYRHADAVDQKRHVVIDDLDDGVHVLPAVVGHGRIEHPHPGLAAGPLVGEGRQVDDQPQPGLRIALGQVVIAQAGQEARVAVCPASLGWADNWSRMVVTMADVGATAAKAFIRLILRKTRG